MYMRTGPDGQFRHFEWCTRAFCLSIWSRDWRGDKEGGERDRLTVSPSFLFFNCEGAALMAGAGGTVYCLRWEGFIWSYECSLGMGFMVKRKMFVKKVLLSMFSCVVFSKRSKSPPCRARESLYF